MKKLLLCLVGVANVLAVEAQAGSFFEPYRRTSLRLPSVPLIVNDPYFSIWSAHNNLYDGATCHWTGQRKAIDGLLRVDGTTYRFMGKDKGRLLKPVAPMADMGAMQSPLRTGHNAILMTANGKHNRRPLVAPKNTLTYVRLGRTPIQTSIYVDM